MYRIDSMDGIQFEPMFALGMVSIRSTLRQRSLKASCATTFDGCLRVDRLGGEKIMKIMCNLERTVHACLIWFMGWHQNNLESYVHGVLKEVARDGPFRAILVPSESTCWFIDLY